MKCTKVIFAMLAVWSLSSNCLAQEFVFKKKISKYVFKPEKGKIQTQYSFDNVEYLSDGTWIVTNEDLCGVFNRDKNILLPVIFQKIDFYTTESNLVLFNDSWGEYREEEFMPHDGEVIFRNPDLITHLKTCASTSGTNEELNEQHENCLLGVIYKNLKYPKEAVANGIEGFMVAELIIDSTGSIISNKILRGLEGGLSEELTRLIRDDLSEWVPAKNGGKSVKSRKLIVVRTKLKG